MFITRLISGVILLALAILLVLLGGDVLLGVVGVISIIGMFELYRVLKMEKSLLAWISYIFAVLYYLNIRFHAIDDILALIFLYLILLMFAYVFSYPKYDAKQVTTAFFGLFYVAGMLSYLYQIRMLNNGIFLAFLVFICSWGSDTCAYCVGMLCNKTIGTHKMAPILSPKKSIEGAIGGVLGAVLLCALYLSLLKGQMGIDNTEILLLSIIAGIGGLISMVGDLTASAIKRNYDIKDYGHLIPGHGGILDRFDSVIITAPIIFYFAYYIFC